MHQLRKAGLKPTETIPYEKWKEEGIFASESAEAGNLGEEGQR